MATDLQELSYRYALRIVKLHEYLDAKRHFVLSKQILRSGTAIGALVAEAQYAQSSADFINKLHVALKEANETLYWLRLIHDSGYLPEKLYLSLRSELESIIRVLTKSIITMKEKQK
ncbi:four helix bundle protein [Nitratifractor sp.]